MNYKYSVTSLLTFIFLSFFNLAFAQPGKAYQDEAGDVSHYYYVKTKDNTKFTGKMIYQNRIEREITFLIYDHYEVIVLQSNIKTMRRVDAEEIIDGDYMHPDVNMGRGVITPNAFGMKQGQLVYRTSNLLYHSLHYGLTPNIAIHAGGELYSSLTLGEPAYHAGISLHQALGKKVRIGANLSFANVYGDYKNLANGYVYTSFGSSHTNISVGYGYAYPVLNSELVPPTQVIPLSLTARLGRHVALISENWLFLNMEDQFIQPAMSGGIRLMWERVSLDLALIYHKEIKEELPIGFLPMVNFSYSILD